MARIAGINLPADRHLGVALTYIYGIGRPTALTICKAVGIAPGTPLRTLSEQQIDLVRGAVGKYKVEGDVRRIVGMNVKRLMDIGCYRGQRHKRHLPVHGQRTRTNARTRKGPRVRRSNMRKRRTG